MLLTFARGAVHVFLDGARATVARFLVAGVACCLALAAAQPAAAGQDAPAGQHWLTDYKAALATAESTGRPVLALFTGSDWCPHCKTLEHNVFGSDLFRNWAEQNVVLLMIDLPQAGITQEVRNERSQVCINYGVRTFPSVLLLGPDGGKITAQTGYKGQSAGEWLARMQEHMPAPQVVAQEAEDAPDTAQTKVHDSLDEAVATARGSRRPILLVVARPGDTKAKTHSESLINDHEFGSFTRENFVVAQVAPAAGSNAATAAPLDALLGGAELPPDSVELIVTDDGQTPLFSQSGSQPPSRIIHGLRRFLAARQAARHTDQARR
ncbi:MAG: thioredoxin family protein [Planctomycetia bacterium]